VDFPSLKSQQLLAILQRKPLSYRVEKSKGGRKPKGSHFWLESDAGYPRIRYSFHDGKTINGGVIRRLLKEDVGLTEEEAFKIATGKKQGKK
jgi:predicted RNA binding protein YcfA (HicA-like mRNA interferase family)